MNIINKIIDALSCQNEYQEYWSKDEVLLKRECIKNMFCLFHKRPIIYKKVLNITLRAKRIKL